MRLFQPLPRDICSCAEDVVCLCHISDIITLLRDEGKLVLEFVNQGLIQLVKIFHPLQGVLFFIM